MPSAPRLVLIALAALLAQAGAAAAVGAQSATAGTTPLLLRLPIGTRALAMGGAGAAVSEAEAVFHNPAELVSARGVAGGVQRYAGGATLASVAIALPVAPGGFAFGVRALDYDAPCANCGAALPRAERTLAVRDALPAAAIAATVAFAREVSGLRLGAAAKWVEQRIPEARGGAAAVDVGLAYHAGPVELALAARDIGQSFGSEIPAGRRELPRSATAGAAVDDIELGSLDFSAAADLTVYDGGGLTAGGGLELGYAPLDGYAVAGRVGVRHVPYGGVSALSLGVAATRDRIGVEYAFQPIVGRGALHRFGLRLRAP